MKIGKNLLISMLLVAILLLPATVVIPTAAVSSVKPSIPKSEVVQSSQTEPEQTASTDSRSTDVLRQFQSYLPEERVDPGIKVEIQGGAADVKIIVFYDLALKESVIASVPSSVRIHTDFWGALPFLSMKAPADMSVIEAIAGISGVRGVYLDRKLYAEFMPEEQVVSSPVAQFESPYEGVPPFLLNQTTELIGAPELWDLGFTGEGVVIAITDTGINKNHPDFYFPATGKNKVIFNYTSVDYDFDGNADVGFEDAHGHGTHVASIAAGTGRTGGGDYFYDPTNDTYRTIWLNPGDEKGVAPDAYLMNIKISQDGWAYTSWMMEGYVQAVLHGADVISTSFGGHYESPLYDFPFIYTVEWAVQNGVVVSISAGNEGPDFGTISFAGHSDSVICVGATTELDRVAWFSSRGPSTALAVFGNSFFPYMVPYANASGSQKMKPDIVAPGVRVSAANAFYYGDYSSLFYPPVFTPQGTMYVSVSGTSMAAPHVAGAAALLLQAFPGAKPAAVKAGLLEGADDLGLDPNVQGFGRLNATAAYYVMNATEKAFNTIGSPLEDIPAYPPTYPPYEYFEGKNILVENTICNYGKFSEFIDLLNITYGANIYYYSNRPFANLSRYDMLLMLEPTTKGTGWLSNSTIRDYVTKWGGKLLLTGDWLSMIPKPDNPDPYAGYNYYTKVFGVTWRDTVGGGYSTNITDHAITEGVDTLYFGGPLGSLVTGSGATTIAYDPVFSGVDVFTMLTGKVVVMSDDDVLDDDYLTNEQYESDNLRLGLNIIAWFAGIETTIFDQKVTVEIHDIGMGIRYPLYIVNGTSTTITFTISNFGNYTEGTVYAWLKVFNSSLTLTYNKTKSSGGLGAGENATITFTVPPQNMTSGSKNTDVAYIWGLVSLWANFTSPYGDAYPANNYLPWVFGRGVVNIITKNVRTGDNPILSLTEPSSYDSYTSPFVAAFPGDWKPLNMSFVTSGNIVNGTMRIEGNVTEIADFYFYNHTSKEMESLGDSKNFTLKDVGWWQPTSLITVARSPTADSGQWTSGSNAYSSNNQYASTNVANSWHLYRTYNFAFPSDASDIAVWVGIEAYTTEEIGLSVSWNGGHSWSAEQLSGTLPISDPDMVTWFDFTGATTWTPTELSNANFRVRIVHHRVHGVAFFTYLDWIPVKVTYRSTSAWRNPTLYGIEEYPLTVYPPYIVPALNSTGHAFGYLEVKIPEDADTGVVYTGKVGVYNGTTLVSSMPMSIEVKEPLARLLYDDLGHYYMLNSSLTYVYESGVLPPSWLYDYKFLWNAYYDLWVKASEWGLDIDSLVMTEYFMETSLNKTLEEELPWRYEQIITSTFEETYSQYGVILEFNNKLLDLYDDFSLVYYRELDSGLYGSTNVTYTLLDIYDLIVKAGGNVVVFAELAPIGGPNPYNVLLNFLGADIELSSNSVFNWTVTKDHMADFPHWITHDVENFTMAGWSLPGYSNTILDYGGYFLDMNETGITAVLTNIESPHPYPNNYANEWNITVPGAESIRVHFTRIDLEEDTGDRKGDWIKVYDNNHTLIDCYTDYHEDKWTSWVPGNTTYIKMSTDQDLQSWGFKIDMYEYESEDGVQVLSMATQADGGFQSSLIWWWKVFKGWEWGPVMAIDEHLAPFDATRGISPSTGLPYTGSKVFVLGEANQFENLFLEYQDWLTSDFNPSDLTAGYGKSMTWTTETLLHNILTYMSDRAAPTTTITYSDPSYLSDRLYVNASTVFTISASDPLTDVAATYYKINEEEWKTYSGSFNLTTRADGNHTIYYYSVDVVENAEQKKSLALYLDDTPPRLVIESIKITPMLTTSSITVSWSVSDIGSGVDHAEIRIDDEAYTTVEDETSYTFSDLRDGAHTVYLRAVDNVGNVGAIDEEGAIVDEIPSEIAVQSYWPYLCGGVVVLVIIIAAAAYAYTRRKKPTTTS